MRMDEIELTRLMKELMRLLQHMPSSEVEEGGIDERVEAIKKEAGRKVSLQNEWKRCWKSNLHRIRKKLSG